MPQWYMTRFPDNMPSLCGSMIVRPMPLWEEGGFTTTMGGGTGTAVTDQTAPEKQQLAKEFLAFAKLTNDAQKALWTRPRLRSVSQRRVRRAALSETDTPDVADWPSTDPCFSGAVTFRADQGELGNVAPEYTGPLYPEARTILSGADHARHRQRWQRRLRMRWQRPSP